MSTPTRIALEQLYRLACSMVVILAEILGKPSPIITRAERRAASQAAATRHEGAYNG